MNRRELLKSLAAGSTAAWCGAGLSLSPTNAAEPGGSAKTRTARLAHLTDIHLYDKRNSAAGLAQALRHAQSLDDPPELIITGGDAVYDTLDANRPAVERQWELWKKVWRDECSLPVKHCVGNHDVWGWNKEKSGTTGNEPGWGKEYALDQFGIDSSHYTFDVGNWRIIVLDSIMADEETVYRGELGEAQMQWLKNELAVVPATTPVALVSHIPIVTVSVLEFIEPLKEDPRRRRVLSHQDARELVHLFRQHPNVKLCLAGHTHLTEQVSFSGVDFVNSGAVSGLWWKGDHFHTDEGYNVIDLYDDGTFATQYQSYGWTVG